jgi:FKBP-type peptidyl-prolyl cis-trans isomerase FkpA
MKKYILILSMIAGLFASCIKEQPPFDAAKQAADDDAAIQAFIKANNITAIKHPSGLYYQVITEGTGAYPTANSTVTVNYSGRLLNGNRFDSGTGVSFPLNQVIPGWTIGIPFVNTGGRILLLVPSALAYGPSSPGPEIPDNSVLVFTVDLLSIQ